MAKFEVGDTVIGILGGVLHVEAVVPADQYGNDILIRDEDKHGGNLYLVRSGRYEKRYEKKEKFEVGKWYESAGLVVKVEAVNDKYAIGFYDGGSCWATNVVNREMYGEITDPNKGVKCG